MTVAVGFTLGTLLLVVILMTVLRLSPDLVLLGALTLLLVVGVVDTSDALSGFSNEGLITVAVLFVVADGLNRTASLAFLGRQLLGTPKGMQSAQVRTMLPTAFLSAFLNNTPVVVLMIPIITDWARKYRLSVSHLLMPLSFAAILGGMCTLIGTSTTMVVNKELPLEYQLGMFDIAWVGVPILIVGLIYLTFCTKYLLPDRQESFDELQDPREYTTEMMVTRNSPLIGQTIEEAGLRQLPGMYLMEIDRRGHVMAAVAPNTQLEQDDRLVFVGIVESVVDLQRIRGLQPATDQTFKLTSRREDRLLVEAVVSNSYPYLRMSIRESRFRSRYNAAVIAVARHGQRIRKKIGDIELQVGDTLLLESNDTFLEQHRNSRHFFLVSAIEESEPQRHELAWVARGILLLMVVVVSLGVLSILKAAMLAAGLMIITRCTRGSFARRAIDLKVLVVMAAGLGIGRAMISSGTDDFLAERLTEMVGTNPYVMLAMIYALTMVLTNLITAKAAALLMLPVAVATARTLNVDLMPFAITVIVSAAASFATPIGYQTNLIIYGPGGYKSNDFLRLGGPLSILCMIVTVIVAPLVWDF
jgi:di/tricarboxylate transporter